MIKKQKKEIRYTFMLIIINMMNLIFFEKNKKFDSIVFETFCFITTGNQNFSLILIFCDFVQNNFRIYLNVVTHSL